MNVHLAGGTADITAIEMTEDEARQLAKQLFQVFSGVCEYRDFLVEITESGKNFSFQQMRERLEAIDKTQEP